MRAFENFLRFEKVLILRLQISLLDQRSYVHCTVYTFSEKCLGDTSYIILYSYLLISSYRDWVRGRSGWVSGEGGGEHQT